MRRAVAGDGDAFGGLMASHRPAALRIATVVLGTLDGAEDVVQQATERTWRAIGTVDPERPFQPWFLRIVANTARNQRRTLGRQARLALRVGGRRPAAEPGPEDTVVTDVERQQVIAAMNRL
ncbi:MAG: RNA polymerase sigma factor, partial [Acidimicrobiia bacterium]|nr:RNA polymerase sigma factor [Acidimicrobiia bacterium]